MSKGNDSFFFRNFLDVPKEDTLELYVFFT